MDVFTTGGDDTRIHFVMRRGLLYTQLATGLPTHRHVRAQRSPEHGMAQLLVSRKTSLVDTGACVPIFTPHIRSYVVVGRSLEISLLPYKY